MVNSYYNTSGKPLSSIDWLLIHHHAKINERIECSNQLAKYKPRSIVDIGCGPGLWLDLFNDAFESNCRFYGIDSDQISIMYAEKLAKKWKRQYAFSNKDVSDDLSTIPPADMYTLFNIMPYIKDIDSILQIIFNRMNPGGKVIIRQYDGSMLRFGPLKPHERNIIENSLFNATSNSDEFHNYDLDRVYSSITKSAFKSKHIEFLNTYRTEPFTKEFKLYFDETINWSRNLASEKAQKYIDEYLNKKQERYFCCVDLFAVLS